MAQDFEKFIHVFNLATGGGYFVLSKIFRYFGNWQFAWEEATAADFARAGLTKMMTAKILEGRSKIDVNREYEKLYEKDIFLVGPGSAEYPLLLKEIFDAPLMLYRKGAALQSGAKFISMVGTRKISSYGEKMALRIAEKIALNDCVVVSGLAIGVDAVCHFGAVKCGKPTVAVLASGVDNVTPATNYHLARKILEQGGTLISEYANYSESYKGRYLERNRIIAGMSKATIVVEAPLKSGARVTARLALEQNRDVYALVGDIGRTQSEGCLELIERDAAQPIFSIGRLLSTLGLEDTEAEIRNLDSQSARVLELLEEKALSGDEVAMRLGLSAAELSLTLTKMELKGLIKRGGDNCWERGNL